MAGFAQISGLKMKTSMVMGRFMSFITQFRRDRSSPSSASHAVFDKESEQFLITQIETISAQGKASDHPDYSYYLHLLLVGTLDKMSRGGRDADKVYQDAILNIFLAVQSWVGNLADVSLFKHDAVLSDASFRQNLEHLRDLFNNLKESNQSLFWEKGQLELMLKLLVPLLFETRNLERTVSRVYGIFKSQVEQLKPVLKQYKVSDFAEDRKPKPWSAKTVDIIPSIVSIPIRQGSAMSYAGATSMVSLLTITEHHPEQGCIKKRGKRHSRLKKIWYCIICARGVKEADEAGQYPVPAEFLYQQKLDAIYQPYEFYQKGFTSHPSSSVKPPEADPSIAILAETHPSVTHAPSVCEGLTSMTSLMKHRLVQLGVTTVDLHYVRTASAKASSTSNCSLASKKQDCGADANVRNLKKTCLKQSEFRPMSNTEPNDEQLSVISDSMCGADEKAESVHLDPLHDTIFSDDRENNYAIYPELGISAIHHDQGAITPRIKESPASCLQYNKSKHYVSMPELTPSADNEDNIVVLSNFSGFPLPREQPVDKVRRWREEQELKKSIAYVHQTQKPLKIDSIQVLETDNANDKAELYTMEVPPFDLDSFPEDQFTAFMHKVVDGRVMLEGAQHALNLLEFGLNNCRFTGMLSDPSECMTVRDLVNIMVEKGGAYLHLKGQDPAYRKDEHLVTLCFASVMKNAEKCVQILGEFLEILHSDIMLFEEIVGGYCDMKDENALKQLFGGSTHHDLKPGTQFDLGYRGVKVSPPESWDDSD